MNGTPKPHISNDPKLALDELPIKRVLPLHGFALELEF